MHWRKRSQAEIFDSFGWWDKGCFLRQMTDDRCDYIQTCLEQAMGEGALQRHQILEVGCGGGLVCEELARRGADMLGGDPSPTALQTPLPHPPQKNHPPHPLTYTPAYPAP